MIHQIDTISIGQDVSFLFVVWWFFEKKNAEGELLLLLDGDVGDKNALEFEFELDRIEGEWREVGVGSDSCDRCGDGNCDDEFNLEAARLPFSNKDAGDLQRSLSFSFFLFTIL